MMADETTPEPQATGDPAHLPEDAALTEPQAPPAAAKAGATDAPPKAPDALAEAAEAKDRLLRTLAEMENLRRRTERELADTRQYAVASFARDMLTVGDNLRRAIEAVPAEKRGSGDAALDALVDGVEVTERGLEQALTKYGVRRVEAKGQKFDPTFHQAMFEVESAELAPGMVAEEVQAGYAIGERVLRPALVAIVKRPKPAAAPAAPRADDDAETGIGESS
jgi:molecular chaperone GrpE